MYCVMCGREIADTAKFCPYCGRKIEGTQKPVEPSPTPVQPEEIVVPEPSPVSVQQEEIVVPEPSPVSVQQEEIRISEPSPVSVQPEESVVSEPSPAPVQQEEMGVPEIEPTPVQQEETVISEPSPAPVQQEEIAVPEPSPVPVQQEEIPAASYQQTAEETWGGAQQAKPQNGTENFYRETAGYRPGGFYQQTTEKSDTTEKPGMKGNALKIGFFILAGICGVIAFRSLLSAIQYFSYGSGFIGVTALLGMLCYIGLTAMLIIIALTEDATKIKLYFKVLCGIAVALAIGGVISFIIAIFNSFTGYYGYFSFMYFFQSASLLLLKLVAMAAVVGLSYCLLQLGGKTPDLSDLAELGADIKSKAAEKSKAASQSNTTASYAGANYGAQNAGANYGAQNAGMNYYTQGVVPLKTDRGLLGYILLSILTCGIYGYYFIYTLARDVNVACSGDGKTTGGLLKFILLSILTCGIYGWWWQYSLGNRLAENAPRYGMTFTENGTTVLMWILFGALLCGIGPFVAMNIIIKNTNSICMAYNRQNGLI